MRKATSGKKGQFKSSALKLVFAVAAAASFSVVQDVLTDYYEQQDRLLHSYTESYIDAVNAKDSIASQSLLIDFKYKGLSEDQIQLIKNTALLDVAEKGKFGAVDIALENGASIDSQNIYSEDFSTLLFASKDWAAYRYLKDLEDERDDFDLKFLTNDDYLQWSLLSKAARLGDDDVTLEAFLYDLKFGGVDLTRIGQTLEGGNEISLVDIARDRESSALMMFLEREGVYADNPEALRWNYDLYADYLHDASAPVVDVSSAPYDRTSFKGYGSISYGGEYIADNDLDPTLFVVEKLVAEKEGDADNYRRHIDNTGYVAYGVSKTLNSYFSWDEVSVIAAQMNLNAGYGGLGRLLEYAAHDYVIVSQSTRMVPKSGAAPSAAFYQAVDNEPTIDFTSLDKDYSYAYYLAAGNDRAESCIDVDARSFCMQDTRYTSHNKNIVRVGAVTQEEGLLSAPVYTVAKYSELRPTFCAVLTERDDVELRGTSFAAPAAAAVERKLADIFARSAAFPMGVTHDDIVMALMLTSQTEGLIDEVTGKLAPVYRNNANIKMTDLCGTGVIRPQKAADLLEEMVGWSIEGREVTQTQARLVKAPVLRSSQRGADGAYSYSVRVNESGLLTSLRAGMFFDLGNKGAADIQIGDLAPVTLDLSASGLTTDFRFAGYEFSKGDVIKITTTKPLLFPASNSGSSARPFVDLKLVQTTSQLAEAIKRLSQVPAV